MYSNAIFKKWLEYWDYGTKADEQQKGYLMFRALKTYEYLENFNTYKENEDWNRFTHNLAIIQGITYVLSENVDYITIGTRLVDMLYRCMKKQPQEWEL